MYWFRKTRRWKRGNFIYKTKSQRTGERHELHVQETEQPRQVSSIAKDDLSLLNVLHLMDRVMIPVKGWSFGRWRRIGCMVAGLWWFDSPWLDCCSCSRRWRNHHLDSMQHLQNCVIILSGSHAPWDLSLWTILPEDETSLPRLWWGWVSWPAEPTAMEGKGGGWIVECAADRKEGATGSLYRWPLSLSCMSLLERINHKAKAVKTGFFGSFFAGFNLKTRYFSM